MLGKLETTSTIANTFATSVPCPSLNPIIRKRYDSFIMEISGNRKMTDKKTQREMRKGEGNNLNSEYSFRFHI